MAIFLFNSRYSCNLLFFSVNDNFRILYFRYFIVVYRSPPPTKNRLTFPLFLEEFTSFLERLSFRLIDYCFSPSLTLPPHLYCFPLAPIPKPPPADFCFRPPSTTTTTLPSIPAATINSCTTILLFLSYTPGADPGFFLGGGALVSCSTSTPINHIVFFFAEYQLY